MTAVYSGLAFFFVCFSVLKVRTVWIRGDKTRWLVQLAFAAVSWCAATQFALLAVRGVL